jgi:hypothetical protein
VTEEEYGWLIIIVATFLQTEWVTIGPRWHQPSPAQTLTSFQARRCDAWQTGHPAKGLRKVFSAMIECQKKFTAFPKIVQISGRRGLAFNSIRRLPSWYDFCLGMEITKELPLQEVCNGQILVTLLVRAIKFHCRIMNGQQNIPKPT